MQIRSTDEHAIMAAHLAKYRSLMPSLALILHRCDSEAERVGLDPGKCAAAWCDYLEAHARRVYQTVTARVDAATALLGERIKAGKLESPFTAREAYRPQWTGLTKATDVELPLEELEARGWLASEEVNPATGRRTLRYHINPRIREVG